MVWSRVSTWEEAMPKADLTPKFIETAKVLDGQERTFWWDNKLTLFGLMVTQTGHKSFVVQYRNTNGKERRKKLSGPLDVVQARKLALKMAAQVADGHDPVGDAQAALANECTLASVVEQYLKFKERAGDMRSLPKRRRVFALHILPKLGSCNVSDIKRSDIFNLTGKIVERGENALARDVLVALCTVLNWYSLRNDSYASPCVKGMGSQVPTNKPRDRFLSDDELRLIWRAAEETNGPYGYLIMFLLLTATRLREASDMRWSEVSGDLWTVPGLRYKGKRDHEVPLSKSAQSVLRLIRDMDAPAVVKESPYTFTFTGRVPMSGFNMFKIALDKRVTALNGAPLPNWTPHDLRRTGRSLMARVGVPSHIAELCLGHKLQGIEAVYNLHPYLSEKRDAFERLAGEVGRILNPEVPNVVPIKRRK
jgi:integrase